MIQKFRESLQISVKVNFRDKNFVITLNFRDLYCPTYFLASTLYSPPHDMRSSYFVNKIFVTSRKIYKNIVPRKFGAIRYVKPIEPGSISYSSGSNQLLNILVLKILVLQVVDPIHV